MKHKVYIDYAIGGIMTKRSRVYDTPKKVTITVFGKQYEVEELAEIDLRDRPEDIAEL
tara:strand:- start:302 stop:475 length:174 start_codon:yes stop_codon:yes gene_type:complete